MKEKNIFKKLTGLEGKSKRWQVADSKTIKSEKWIYHILPADAEAPSIEGEKKNSIYLLIIAFMILAFILLSSRIFSLEIINGSKNLKLSDNNRIREIVLNAPRGIIYDTNGVPLVKNIPEYDVTITPSNLPLLESEREGVIKKLSNIIGMSVNDIKNITFSKGISNTQPVLVKQNVGTNESILIESDINDLSGVSINVNSIRNYLDNGLLSQTLGYVGKISSSELSKNPGYTMNDYIGKSGIEESYEKVLRGVPGQEKIEVDSTGQNEKILGTKEPIPGKNIKLTIDMGLQQELVTNMEIEMQKAKVTKASAVAINPQTGAILALVSLPSYNDNLFSNGISETDFNKLLQNPDDPLLNRPIAGEYPSGSSIKPFIASGALQEGTITESTTVNSTGGIHVGSAFFPDWEANGAGITNVTKALADSVNTFFYAVGGGYENVKGLGPDKIKAYLEKFGFNKYSGVDIPGEAEGSIPDPAWKEATEGQPWYLGDTYNMSIGQGGVLVTPLQIADATVAIANGGNLLKPHILGSIIDANGNVISTARPEVTNKQVVSPQNISIVQAGMRLCVTGGSCGTLKTLSVDTAGKTGTAQFGPNNSKEHAWYTSYAPFINPTIELTVLIEGAGGGDVYAEPVAKSVFQYYFSR